MPYVLHAVPTVPATACDDCGMADSPVAVLPVRWLTDDELVAGATVRACAYCRDLREETITSTGAIRP